MRRSDEDDLVRGFLRLSPRGKAIVIGIVVLILIAVGIVKLADTYKASHPPQQQSASAQPSTATASTHAQRPVIVLSPDVLLGKTDNIEVTSIDKFFDELQESDEAEHFESLHRKIDTLLPGAIVVRAGRIRVDVYLIGERDGEWLGLQTRSIET